MKNGVIVFACLLVLILGIGQSEAVSLSIQPANEIIHLGEALSLDVIVNGLTSGGPPSLGAFSFDITFDQSILTFTMAQFNHLLGNPENPDPLAPETYTSINNSTPGLVRLEEVSYLSDLELDNLQGDTFSLMSLSFLGNSVGSSAIGLGNIVLSDAFGDEIDSPTFSSGMVEVNPVPEPSTGLLLLVSLFCLGVLKIKEFI